MRKIAVIIIISMLGFWLGGMVGYHELIPSKQTQINKKYDAIIILTGGERRITDGINLLAEGKANQLLVTGVGKDVKAAELLNKMNLPPHIAAKIDLGKKARSTIGNVHESKEWIEENNIKTAIIVTGNYHIPRAIRLFKSRIKDLEILPYPVFPKEYKNEKWPFHKNTARLVLKEYNKFLVSF